MMKLLQSPRCSYKEALQETPEASVMAKENFPIIPQRNLNKFYRPVAGTISVFWSFFRAFQIFLDPESQFTDLITGLNPSPHRKFEE